LSLKNRTNLLQELLYFKKESEFYQWNNKIQKKDQKEAIKDRKELNLQI